MRVIAVPLDAEPVQAIRADAALWEVADLQPPFGRRWPGEELSQISRALLAVMPAGAGWEYSFPSRSHQQAEYLLDPSGLRARAGEGTGEQRERTMAYRVVHGDEAFAEHATSGQGIPWRCSTTAFLTTALQLIDGLDVGAVRREFSVAEMVALGVYKVQSDEDDDAAFARVLGELRAFGEQCRRAVRQDLDLIINLY